MIFKGGTLLSKVLIPNKWRYFEDLDFTVHPDTDPKIIMDGFDDIFEILHDANEIEWNGKLAIPESGRAAFGDVQFTGPLGTKNRIKIDISRVEKIIDAPIHNSVTVSYEDLTNFPITNYTFNEALSEKIRSITQRVKARDYYDVWSLFTQTDYSINKMLIADMVKQKCANVPYDPSPIQDSTRLVGLKKYWNRELTRLLRDKIPNPDLVFLQVSEFLKFLPKQ